MVKGGVLVAVGERQLCRHWRTTGTIRAVSLSQSFIVRDMGGILFCPNAAERLSWMQYCKNNGGNEDQGPIQDHEWRFGLERG